MTRTNNNPDDAATYYQAAIEDEINGYALTAAMEWQKAAELFSHLPIISHICWQQWERIMQLPRTYATPIATAAPLSEEPQPRLAAA